MTMEHHRYLVIGADLANGKERSLEVDASSADAAAQIAVKSHRIAVSRVERTSAKPSTGGDDRVAMLGQRAQPAYVMVRPSAGWIVVIAAGLALTPVMLLALYLLISVLVSITGATMRDMLPG